VVARERIWVGIDVGKVAHHAHAVDAEGKTVFSQRVDNAQRAIEAVLARAQGEAVEVRWALDMTSGMAGLLIAVLNAAGPSMTYVPGKLVNRMSGAFAGEAKTDAKDAHTIAETARLRTDLTVIAPADQLVVELQALTSHRTDLKGDWVRGVNRIRALLGGIFPGLERVLDLSKRSPLILLTAFPTPAGLRQAGAATVRAHLVENGAYSRAVTPIVATAMQAAAEQTIAVPGERVTAVLIAQLAVELLELDRRVKNLDKHIADLFAGHEHAPRITSVAGFGPTLGAQLLADTGGDLQASFGTAARLAAYAGLAPVPRDSGRITGNLQRPRRYHRGLQNVFYMAAFSSINRPGPSKTFYDRKRAEGKRHHQALLALARRLVDVIWALLRDRRIFEPDPPPRILPASVAPTAVGVAAA
jgi:transposase